MDQDGVILIVSHNPTHTLKISHSLNQAGLMVRVANNADNAIKQAKSGLPHLIIVDIQHSEDGFQTCRQLQLNHHTRQIPIICLTASCLHSKANLSLGVVDYISKPFYEDEVVARVNVQLKLQQLSQQVAEQTSALQEAHQKLQDLTPLDDLTQTANRRRFDEYLEEQWRRLAREKASLSVVLCEVDYFKEYSATYGDQAGEHCLKQITQVLRRCVKRPADLIARYRDAQFAIILPNTSSAGAVQVAKVISLEIQQLNLVHSPSQASDYVSVSLGISSQIPEPASSVQELVAVAEQALYHAKAQGGNTHSFHRSCLLNSA